MTNYLVSQLVINWYHKNGRKNLPWQTKKTLYKIWISEIMLQQTTVKSVIPYFEKFILTFPSVESIYNSQLDEILYIWSGLGYYNRAKNIYKAAKIITMQYNGIFPSTFLDVIKLPGIGKSTAGAILSLSLNFFYPILDGNVKRILVRYYGIIGSLKDKKIEKKLWHIIELITPIHNTGKFNQALMDIGSLICTYAQPKCNICPLKKRCIAKIEQKWENYPLKNKKKIRPKKTSWFVLIEFNNTFFIQKNTKKELWKNLFCFPSFDTEGMALNWINKYNLKIKKQKKMKPFIHHFSHFILNINPILIKLSSIFLELNQEYNTSLWYNLRKPQHIGIPKPVQKILEIFQKDIFKKEH